MTNREQYLSSLSNDELASILAGNGPEKRPWCPWSKSVADIKYSDAEKCNNFAACSDCIKAWLKLAE